MTLEQMGWELEDASMAGENQQFQWRKRDAKGRIIAYEDDETWRRDLAASQNSPVRGSLAILRSSPR